MKRTDGSVYVLGSGASLLKLTPDEKEYLQGQVTVAMNKYLLFWDLVEVYPDYLYMADDHYPAPRVVQESFLLSERLNRPVHWLLNALYQNIFGLSAERLPEMMSLISEYKEQYGFDYQPHLRISPVTYFVKVPAETYTGWASSIDERMCAMRGSLTTLINLLCVLGIGRDIKLLGVDLSSAESFYDSAFRGRRELHDFGTRVQFSKPVSPHFTAIRWFGSSGIQDDLPYVIAQAAASGYRVLCCNPDSLLVKSYICEYAPIISQ